MGDAFEDRTQCMTPERSAFLAHWLRLVDLEEGDQSARRAEIWALPGGQLGNSGRMPFVHRAAWSALVHWAGLLSQPDQHERAAAGLGKGVNNREVQSSPIHTADGNLCWTAGN